MSGRTSVRRVSRLAVAGAVLLAAGFGASLRADVLKVAPTDSLGVFKVKNVGAVSKKVGDLANRLGIAAFKPELADPLGSLKTELKVTKGLKEDGEFGVVLLPATAWPDHMGPDTKPAMVMLVPVSSYDEFVSNFEGAKTEDGVTSFDANGETTYVMQWGDYAALAPTKEYVAMKGGGIKVNAAAQKEFDAKDAVLWANIPAIKAAYGPKLTEAKPGILSKFEAELSEQPEMAKYAPVGKAAVSQVLAAAETFLNESQGATISWNLTDAGINSAIAAEFAEGSYLGKWTNSLKATGSKSFTQGLPAGPYLVFGGASLNGPAVTQAFKDFATPIVEEAKKIEGVGADAEKTLNAALDMFNHVKQSNWGMLAPKGGLGQESLFQMAYYIKGDAKQYVAAMKEYGESYARAMAPLEGTPMMPFKMSYKVGGKTVDGVTFDTLEMAMNPNPKTPEEANMLQVMTMMYGPGGLSYNTAALDDSTAIMFMGLPDASVSKFIASAKSGSDDLAGLNHIQATAKELPSSPLAVNYIALDEIIRTGVNAARQFGMPANFQLPENLPPIGVALDSEGSTLRVDGHLPTELVQSIVAAVIMMQGGGGGGGGF